MSSSSTGPAGCECGHVFVAAERVAAGEPARHQVEELPVMAVQVTEHQCQRVICPGCGAKAAGVLPAEFASAHGPRLQAAIVTLSVRNRISRRDTVELCEQLFSSRISTGTVEAILTRTRRRAVLESDGAREFSEDRGASVRDRAATGTVGTPSSSSRPARGGSASMPV